MFFSSHKRTKKQKVQQEDSSIAGSEKEQMTIITKHFIKSFSPEEHEILPTIPPTKMTISFTQKNRNTKGIKKHKNQQSVKEDGLNAEFVKYGLLEIHLSIATLLNKMAITGKHTDEIKKEF